MKKRLISCNTRQQVFISFFKKNYFLFIFIACIGFVGIFVFNKIFISKPTYIYAKVKVGQGMWWANTMQPNLWFIEAIQNAYKHSNQTYSETAKILDVTYYPYYGSVQSNINGQYQYSVYTVLRLKVSKVEGSGTYNFNRETIGIGSPIDLEFPNIQFSGTIIDLSEQPIKEQYEEKIIYLTKRIPYPWEYDQIEVGDKQTNGERIVFEILNKTTENELNTTLLQQGTFINSNINLFTVKAKILVKKVDNQLVFGEESIIAQGKLLFGVATDKFTFTDYYITKVE